MRMMKYSSRIYLNMMLATAMILAVGSRVFVNGPLREYLLRRESLFMLAELAVFSAWNFFWLSRGKARYICAGILAPVVAFLWMHQALVPVAVSGIYLALILAAGHAFKFIFRLVDDHEPPAAGILTDFLAGYALWLVLVCFLSLLKLGSITNLRTVVFLWGVFVVLCGLGHHSNWNRKMKAGRLAMHSFYEEISKNRLLFAGMGVLLLVTWMIQAGRLNIALDYDSLHYGLRSAYVLDNGTGIYENLGNINLVYTYSKGFEVLGLPLAGTATYGYVLAMNLWITILVLAAVFLLADTISGRKPAYLAIMLAAGVPALMNMSVTAKSDNLTLLLQLICMYGFCRCIQERNKADLLTASGAYLLTLTLKPTAIVFSTVLFGVSLMLLLRREKRLFWIRLSVANPWWLLFLIAAAAWLGIWARTWYLTGVPVTSIFTGLLEQVGFQIKEPFAFKGIPANGTSLTLWENAVHLLSRLYGIMLAPVGEDMGHVSIAWGGSMVTFLLFSCICMGISGGNKKADLSSYLTLLTWSVGAISLISLHLLWQVDGNYYQLFLLLVILLFADMLGNKVHRETVHYRRSIWGWSMKRCLIPFFAFQIIVTCLTNWAGVTGMTPIKWRHKGWYNHMEMNYQQKCAEGNRQIWNLLSEDKTNRVLAFGEHPQVLTFPCNIQSYYDVTGSGGNVWLVKKLDYFKDFLRYAGSRYIYVQAGYLEDGSRAEEIIRFMIEDGSLCDIVYENGNLLGRVRLEPETDVIPDAQ